MRLDYYDNIDDQLDQALSQLIDDGWLILPPGQHFFSRWTDQCLLCGRDLQESEEPCDRDAQ